MSHLATGSLMGRATAPTRAADRTIGPPQPNVAGLAAGGAPRGANRDIEALKLRSMGFSEKGARELAAGACCTTPSDMSRMAATAGKMDAGLAGRSAGGARAASSLPAAGQSLHGRSEGLLGDAGGRAATAGGISGLNSLNMQQTMQKRQQAMSAVSNLLRRQHETSMNAIRNIR